MSLLTHTRLQQVKRNGDMKIEGEITQYQQRNKSVSSEGYSAQTELPSLSMCASQTIQTIAKTLNDSSQLLQAMKLYVV